VSLWRVNVVGNAAAAASGLDTNTKNKEISELMSESC